MLEVYVDNFCAMVQSTNVAELCHISQALLHSIHKVFPPPKVSGIGGENSISLNNLKAGEGTWETRKELLGLVFDGRTRCIKLLTDKTTKIREQIDKTVLAQSVRRRDYNKLLERVRHASLGFPEAQACSRLSAWHCMTSRDGSG